MDQIKTQIHVQTDESPRQDRDMPAGDDFDIDIDPTIFPRPYLNVQNQEIRQKQIRSKRLRNSIKITSVLAVFFVIAFGLGIAVTVTAQRENQHVIAEAYTQSYLNGNQTLPDEHNVATQSLSYYRVPATQPRYLVIPKLSIYSRVERVGVNYKSEIQGPRNINDAGWYEDSSKPGDTSGAILLNGYENGVRNDGLFKQLNNLAIGDKLQIVRGDAQTFQFTVIKKQVYDSNYVDLSAALRSWSKGNLGLNLMAYSSPTNPQQTIIIFAAAQ